LETERKGERFTMIEPPLPPEKPVSPNRVLILAAGFVLSLGAGLGAVMMRETLDPSIRGVNDVRRLLSVAPLAAIPSIVTRAEVRRNRRNTFFRWIGTILALMGATAAVHFFFRPLDVIWLGLLQRFGV
jgi:hypothetical protein